MERDEQTEAIVENEQTTEQVARRGPTAEKERLIDEMIELRRQTMKQSATIASYDEETEIIGNYEYLDHTADIQLHGWGDTLESALEQVAIAMFGYMTSLSRIKISEEQSEELGKDIVVTGHDVQSLVFAFLQEWLYIFHVSGFVARELTVEPIDREKFEMCTSSAKGEIVDWKRHTQGTEVKAVTYSSLQVKEDEDRCDIWIIVDI
jgi:SHS2 domain-containing protein